MKHFIKEILTDAALLSGLIILPMAFLGDLYLRTTAGAVLTP